MSYDLVVFEKKKAPTAQEGFLKWYTEQAEWSGDYDYNDISHASASLQKFFDAVKDIFPPMNGLFAVSDEELDEHPEIEKRLCDYCIGTDMIYLSFGYSIAGMAYDLIKRAAYFCGVGFFEVESNSIHFFDNDMPMLLEGQWFQPIAVSDFSSVREKLYKMTAKNRSFLCLTDQIGSYIQVGGYKDSLTVEKRIYKSVLSYTHEKAEYRTVAGMEEAEVISHVTICGNCVKVRLGQVLSMAVAEELFRDFFEGTEDCASVVWADMEMD